MASIPTNRAATHPGEMLSEEFLAARNPADAVRRSARHLLRALERNRQRPPRVTPDAAIRVRIVLGLSADFWINLQVAWDLYHARHSANARDFEKLAVLPKVVHASSPMR